MRYNTFNETAREYDNIVTPCREHQVRTLVEDLKLTGNEKVLDIGCGSGLLSLEVLKKLKSPKQFTGIDLSEKMLALCRRRLWNNGFKDIDLKIGNSLALEFSDDFFDVIVSSNVLPWVGDQDAFIAEVKRALRPGGSFGLIALHTDVYKEFFKVIDDVRAVYRDCFNCNSVLQDIGVCLEDVSGHCRRLQSAGFQISRGYVLSTQEPIDADEYVRRFNAVTGETQLNSVPENKKDFIRRELYNRLRGKNGSLNVTEAINILISKKAANRTAMQ
ncbi:MAG: methyltransferase domain-containing protein [candidate division Zixibacteria bacterium]